MVGFKALVIADGAAFGAEMTKIDALLLCGKRAVFYLPESFEWVLLSAGLVSDGDIARILQNPEEYVDSTRFFSWERFFTWLLIERTKDTYLHYQKKELNPAYLQKKNVKKVLAVLPGALEVLLFRRDE